MISQRLLFLCLVIGICSQIRVEANFFNQLKGLLNGNGIFDNFDETLKNFKKDDWNQVPCSEFANQNKEKLQQAELMKDSLSEKAQDCLKLELLKFEENKPTILSKFRDASTTMSEQLALQMNFKKPEDMTENDVTDLGVESLRRLSPDFLEKIKDKKAIKKMVSNLNSAVRTEGNAMNKKKLEELQSSLVDKMVGKVNEWGVSDVTELDANRFTTRMIREMPERLLDTSSVFNKLAQEAGRRTDCELGRELVTKMKKLKKITPSSSLAEKGDFFDTIVDGPLKDYYFLEHMDSDLLDVTALNSIASENWKKCASNAKLSPISRSEFRKMNNKELTSSSDLSKITPCGVAALTPSITNSSLEFMNKQTMEQFEECNVGADSSAKRMMMLVHQQKKMAEDINKVYSSVVPMRVAELGQEFSKVTETEAKNILNLPGINLSQEQRETLISRIPTPTERMSPDALATFPLEKLKQLSTSVLQRIGKKLPSTALPNVELGRKVFGDRTKISYNDLIQNKQSLIGMSKMDAKKIDDEAPIFDMLRELKSTRISPSLAAELRDRLVDYTSDGNMNDAIKKLSSVDLENMPLEVIASFGMGLRQFDPQSKKVNMLRLGRSENAKDIPAPLRKEMIREGLGDMGTIPAGSLISLGDLYTDINPDTLRGAEVSTKETVLKKLNMDIMEGKVRPECLDGRWIGAIKGMLRDVKGNFPEWMDIKNEGCLIWTLESSELDALKDEVLDGDTCEPPMMAASLREYDDQGCMATKGNQFEHIKNRMKNMRMKQKNNVANIQKITRMAGIESSRRKRQTVSQDPLEKASIMGLDSVSTAELEDLTPQEVLKWLPSIGTMKMSQERAVVVIKKLLETLNNDVKKVTQEHIRDMGEAFRGFSLDQVKELPVSLFGLKKSSVPALGRLEDWNEEILTEVAKKVRQNINLISNLLPTDISNLNNILCGMRTSDLRIIRAQTFRESVGVFKNLDCEEDNLEEALPSLVEKSYGSASSITSSEIADMGVLINAMSPQNIKDLKAEAYAGLSAKTINEMEANLLKSLDIKGLENVQPETAGLISSAQLNQLPEDMRQALKSNLGYGSANQSAASMLLVLSVILLARWI